MIQSTTTEHTGDSMVPSAYIAGMIAFAEHPPRYKGDGVFGREFGTNPYNSDTREYDSWDRGYKDECRAVYEMCEIADYLESLSNSPVQSHAVCYGEATRLIRRWLRKRLDSRRQLLDSVLCRQATEPEGATDDVPRADDVPRQEPGNG